MSKYDYDPPPSVVKVETGVPLKRLPVLVYCHNPLPFPAPQTAHFSKETPQNMAGFSQKAFFYQELCVGKSWSKTGRLALI